MAWIEKRTKDGKVVSYMVRWREPETGKVVGRARRTHAEATKLRDEMSSQIHNGVYVAQDVVKLPFSEYAKEVLDSDFGLASTTRLNYDQTLRTHLAPLAGIPIGNLDSSRVRTLFSRLREQGISPHVMHMAKKVLSKVCTVAVEDGILRRNPARAVRVPKPERRAVHPLTPEEVASVADSVPRRWRSAVLLAAWGGLRIGEIGALTKDDVDWERGSVRISKSQSAKGLKNAKTKASERTVVLPAFVMKALREHVLAYAGKDGRLFLSEYGNPINHQTIAPVMRKYTDGVRFHDLRHTQAALLIKEGAHPLEIKERLGHSSIKTTMDVYGHLFEGAHDDLARRLEQFAPQEMGKVIELP